MSTDIFDDDGGNQTTTQDTTVTPAPDLSKILPDSLKDMVGEGKKYASVEKALESIPHAQSHIERLETELKDMRSKVESSVATNEVYDTVKKLLEAERKTPEGGKWDEATLAELLDRKLTERDTLAKQQANVQSVKKALEDKYGDTAKEVYNKKAEELGVSVKFLNDVVAASPNAAFELFGVNKSNSTSVPAGTRSTVNTDAFKPQPPTQKASIMGGADTADMVAAWRAAKPTE
jgi:hypothetical protein